MTKITTTSFLNNNAMQSNLTKPNEREKENASTMKLKKSSSIHRLLRNIELTRFLSVDQRSISDTEESSSNALLSHENKKFRTKSCANLSSSNSGQLSTPQSPGAVLIKETFIELPKQKVKNFNSSDSPIASTSTSNITSNSILRKDNSINRRLLLSNPRFKTTRVDESELNK